MPTVEELETELQALRSEVSGLKKLYQAQEAEMKGLRQRVQNVHAELFLDEAMAQGPDKIVRMRTTIRGVVKALSQAFAEAQHLKVIK